MYEQVTVSLLEDRFKTGHSFQWITGDKMGVALLSHAGSVRAKWVVNFATTRHILDIW